MSALEDEDGDELKPFSGQASDNEIPIEAARAVGRKMSDSVIASKDFAPNGDDSSAPTVLASPADLAAQLYTNPKLAVLRSGQVGIPSNVPTSLPIIANPKCSGYFVEPVSSRAIRRYCV
jgi:dual specificity phosphatase 12